MNMKKYNKKKDYFFDFLKKEKVDILSVEHFRETEAGEYDEYALGCQYLVECICNCEGKNEDGEEYKKCLVDKKEFDKYVEKKERRKIIWL